MHYGHGESTMFVVESDIKALGHYGLTMAILVDHNPHEFTMALMNLPRLLLDFDIVQENCYYFIVVELITTTVVNVPQP